MDFKLVKRWFLCCLAIGITQSYAQDKDEEQKIKKEDVVVEFSFNPTLSDVFKLKTTPILTEDFPKEEIKYKITSKEVPSDFVPVAKKATYVKVEDEKPRQYSNYVYGAAGMYGNGEFELQLKPAVKRSGYQYGLGITSYNAQGGIDDERVDNGQWKAEADAFLAKYNRNSNWKVDLKYQRNQIHWYGLEEGIAESIYQDLEVQQVYNQFDVFGKLSFEGGYINHITTGVKVFSDNYNSSETQIDAGTVLDSSLFADFIALGVDFQYLNGSFNQTYLTDDSINYSFINVGITPKYSYLGEVFKLDVSLGLFANLDQEASKSNFVFLPNVLASFSLLENIMTLNTGIRSELIQNSYATLSEKNPWVSPTLQIQTTTKPVDVFVGLDGKLTKTLSYNTEVSYQQVKDMALFVNNANIGATATSYQMGNSFGVIYDDVSVVSFKGNIESSFFEKLTGGITATFNSYETDELEEAYNLPSFTLEAYTNYTYKKLNAQLGVNYIDSRKDVARANIVTVDGFVDVNARFNYAITDQFQVHANLYNLTNNQYQTYLNYQVQGIQALGGLSYKF